MSESETMKSLLVFIPKWFYDQKPGYMFGKVTYDKNNDAKKFYIVGLKSNIEKSTEDLIGYYSGTSVTNGFADKRFTNWINVSLHGASFKSSLKSQKHDYCLNSVIVDRLEITHLSYHTVIIVYDQLALFEAELFTIKLPTGDHFGELKQILHSDSIEKKLNKKSIFRWTRESFLNLLIFLFLYPILLCCKLTEKLLPAFKYSSLGMHLNEWLKNAKWALITIKQNRKFTLKTGNYVLAVILDMLFGILILRLILHNTGDLPPSQILLDNAEVMKKTMIFQTT